MPAIQTLTSAEAPATRPCPNCAGILSSAPCASCGWEPELVPVALAQNAGGLVIMTLKNTRGKAVNPRLRAFGKGWLTIRALVPVLATAFLASACGGGGNGIAQAIQSSQGAASPQAAVASPGHDRPEDAVDGLIQAELANNGFELCSYLVPSSQQVCDQDEQTSPLPAFTGNAAPDGNVISGSEALVAVTGSICNSEGSGCASNSDPAGGMPNDQETFAEAYDQALDNSGSFSPVPCIEENGMWYVNATLTAS